MIQNIINQYKHMGRDNTETDKWAVHNTRMGRAKYSNLSNYHAFIGGACLGHIKVEELLRVPDSDCIWAVGSVVEVSRFDLSKGTVPTILVSYVCNT